MFTSRKRIARNGLWLLVAVALLLVPSAVAATNDSGSGTASTSTGCSPASQQTVWVDPKARPGSQSVPATTTQDATHTKAVTVYLAGYSCVATVPEDTNKLPPEETLSLYASNTRPARDEIVTFMWTVNPADQCRDSFGNSRYGSYQFQRGVADQASSFDWSVSCDQGASASLHFTIQDGDPPPPSPSPDDYKWADDFDVSYAIDIYQFQGDPNNPPMPGPNPQQPALHNANTVKGLSKPLLVGDLHAVMSDGTVGPGSHSTLVCCTTNGWAKVQYTVTKRTLLGFVAWRYRATHWYCWIYGRVYPSQWGTGCTSHQSPQVGFRDVDGTSVIRADVDYREGSYYTWSGNDHGGYSAKFRGHISNCILKYGCLREAYPEISFWFNANGAVAMKGHA
jgi:hypothetical protein